MWKSSHFINDSWNMKHHFKVSLSLILLVIIMKSYAVEKWEDKLLQIAKKHTHITWMKNENVEEWKKLSEPESHFKQILLIFSCMHNFSYNFASEIWKVHDVFLFLSTINDHVTVSTRARSSLLIWKQPEGRIVKWDAVQIWNN